MHTLSQVEIASKNWLIRELIEKGSTLISTNKGSSPLFVEIKDQYKIQIVLKERNPKTFQLTPVATYKFSIDTLILMSTLLGGLIMTAEEIYIAIEDLVWGEQKNTNNPIMIADHLVENKPLSGYYARIPTSDKKYERVQGYTRSDENERSPLGEVIISFIRPSDFDVDAGSPAASWGLYFSHLGRETLLVSAPWDDRQGILRLIDLMNEIEELNIIAALENPNGVGILMATDNFLKKVATYPALRRRDILRFCRKSNHLRVRRYGAEKSSIRLLRDSAGYLYGDLQKHAEYSVSILNDRTVSITSYAPLYSSHQSFSYLDNPTRLQRFRNFWRTSILGKRQYIFSNEERTYYETAFSNKKSARWMQDFANAALDANLFLRIPTFKESGMPLYIEAIIWPKELTNEHTESKLIFDIYDLSQVKKRELYWSPFYRA